MRDLTASDRNEMTINDTRSGSEILVYYRNPTTEEEIAYQANLFRRKGKKMKIAAFNTRLRFGLKIINGFRDGDFGLAGKPISSDPVSPNYREDWKSLISSQAPDILNAFAFAVFEGARVDTGMNFEFEGEETEGNAGEEEAAGSKKDPP